MRTLLAPLLVIAPLLAATPAATAERPVLEKLLSLAGADEAPAVPPVSGVPVETAGSAPSNTLLCSMSMEYKETVKQLLVIRLWKELEGDAVVACPGHDPVKLRLQGSGPSIGVGLPNGSPFTSVNEVIAGSLSVRVTAPFVPHHLEGDYVHAGIEIGGIGGGLSPWVNSDASLQMVLYLPGSFNASAGINLQTLRLYLMP